MSFKKTLFDERSSLLPRAADDLQTKKREEIRKLLQLIELSIVDFQKAKSKAYQLQSSLQQVNDVYKHIPMLTTIVDTAWLKRYRILPVIEAIKKAHDTLHQHALFEPRQENADITDTIKDLEKEYCHCINHLPTVIENQIQKKRDDYVYLESEMLEKHCSMKNKY